MKVALSSIRIDGGTQPPGRLNQEHVDAYSEDMLAGRFDWSKATEPVVVFDDGGDRWLAHGFHRYHAAKKAGLEHIIAEVKEGTQADAQVYATSCNRFASLRRSNSDKRWAVETMLRIDPSMSANRIADHVGVSQQFVSELKKGTSVVTPEVVVGKDGKTYPATKKAPPPPPPPDDEEPFHPPANATLPPPPDDDEEPAVRLDKAGQPITEPSVAQAFDDDAQLLEVANLISDALRLVRALAEQPIGAELRMQRIEADLANARTAVQHARPHAQCPYMPNCANGCKACKGRLWIIEQVWKAVPPEIRGT